jgi:carbonic anhydrase
LDGKFAVCASGKNQSLIDLKAFIQADLKPLKLDYKAGIADILNNGHTVQINYGPGSSLTVDGFAFELKQFHFHSPSENKVNGKQFPLEGHLVHADKDGNLAVVAVMFQEGAANTLLTRLWEKMLDKAGEKSALQRTEYNAIASEGTWLLPLQRIAHHAAVQWRGALVRDEEARHIEQFSKAIGFANNRPIQATNARTILQ